MAKFFKTLLNPRCLYRPEKFPPYKAPVEFPNLDAPESEFRTFLEKSEWGQRIIKSIMSLRKDKVEKMIAGNDCYHINAKDVILGYYSTPIGYREPLVDALIKCKTIVNGTPFPAEWGIEDILGPAMKLNRPLTAVRAQPHVPGMIYVHVDAAVEKTGMSGLGYVLLYNSEIVDEGCMTAVVKDSHEGEVRAVNLGFHVAKNFVDSMSQEEREKLVGVCMCCDSASALNQSSASVLVSNKDTHLLPTLWNTYSLMHHFDTCYFHHISRELNTVADYLATYALDNLESRAFAKVFKEDKFQEKEEEEQVEDEAFDAEKYKGLCRALINREVRVGFKAGPRKPIVI